MSQLHFELRSTAALWSHNDIFSSLFSFWLWGSTTWASTLYLYIITTVVVKLDQGKLSSQWSNLPGWNNAALLVFKAYDNNLHADSQSCSIVNWCIYMYCSIVYNAENSYLLPPWQGQKKLFTQPQFVKVINFEKKLSSHQHQFFCIHALYKKGDRALVEN